jgi:IS30 family transposase
MSKYHRLTHAERYQIAVLLDSGFSVRQIAGKLQRSASTISREIQRNKNVKSYDANTSQKRAQERRRHVGPGLKLQGELLEYVLEKLRHDWSPQQIQGRILLERGVRISHETIYKHIYSDSRSELWTHLRRKRKRRKPRSQAKKTYNIGIRTNRTWIEKRPQEVEARERLGDVERDTIEGRRSGSLLLTTVDRTSRLTRIRWIEKKNAYLIHEATVEMLKDMGLKTITNDNGAEFGLHDMTAKELNTSIYFSRPYSSWQRGSIENMNGLIRQYFPHRSPIEPGMAQRVEDLLNNRPRKCLGYRTPNEVHEQLSRVLR